MSGSPARKDVSLPPARLTRRGRHLANGRLKVGREREPGAWFSVG
jgi:hypothetical protein